MRGHRSIFQSLFPDETVVAALPAERRGRSEALIAKRNELLICRYYFYAKLLGYRYEAALSSLEDELFIAQRTIINTLDENRDILKRLNADKTDIKRLQNRFPFMVWKQMGN